MRPILLLFMCCILSACEDTAPVGEVATQNNFAIEVSPAPLPLSAGEFLANSVNVSKIFASPVGSTSNFDAFSGGESRLDTFKGASANVYTLEDGRLWRARINAGFGDQCSSALASVEAIRRFTALFGKTLSVAEEDALAKALQRDEVATATAGSVKFSASGGCIDTLTATAIGLPY